MADLTLYSTSGCHLCEIAESLMSPYLASNQLKLDVVDIADSDQLVERYGLRIPVLSLNKNSAELDWPFELSEFLDFIATQ